MARVESPYRHFSILIRNRLADILNEDEEEVNRKIIKCFLTITASATVTGWVAYLSSSLNIEETTLYTTAAHLTTSSFAGLFFSVANHGISSIPQIILGTAVSVATSSILSNRTVNIIACASAGFAVSSFIGIFPIQRNNFDPEE